MGKVPRYFTADSDKTDNNKSLQGLKTTIKPFKSIKPSSTDNADQQISKKKKPPKMLEIIPGAETKPEIETIVASKNRKRLNLKKKKHKLKPGPEARKKLKEKKLKMQGEQAQSEKESNELPPVPAATLKKYSRGKGLSNPDNFIKTDYRRSKIMKKDEKVKSGLENAARSEILLLENPGAIEVEQGEHTLQLKQIDIIKKVDISSATKGFHLNLDKFGPYTLNYTTNGRYLVLGGRKGHVAAFDWVTKNLMCEMGVMESVHDVVWLHNENMFAVAQKEWTYVYDNQGIEIHCLKKMDRVMRLDFLPYHFLLVGGHQSGFLSWVDVSIGKIVAQFNARQGPLGIMTTNPSNAVVHCGHNNGTVSLWAPTVKKPLASILCHGAPLSSIAVDSVGRLMATSAKDSTLRIWDLRNSFTPLTSVKVGIASSLSFSQRGLLAMSTNNQALIFSEVGHRQKPYLKHVASSQVNQLKFCPFEDILGVGTVRGFDSVIVPGSGEPNFDALERNPFQTKTQRREAEVKALLEKIQPELISLDNNILGEVDTETLKDTLDKKPKYVKKADIQLSHRKKRKAAKLPRIKDALRTELNLKMAREQEQSERGDGKNRKTVELATHDPLFRFVSKKKK